MEVVGHNSTRQTGLFPPFSALARNFSTAWQWGVSPQRSIYRNLCEKASGSFIHHPDQPASLRRHEGGRQLRRRVGSVQDPIAWLCLAVAML